MPRDIIFDNVKYYSLEDTQKLSGYTPNYIARLCREGDISARKIGKVWYVEAESFLVFLDTVAKHKEKQRIKLSKERQETLRELQRRKTATESVLTKRGG